MGLDRYPISHSEASLWHHVNNVFTVIFAIELIFALQVVGIK